MSDGRRHSVDIPLSKTLVALRRVRSLRDPSTNSMSKFSALVDNLSWETNSRDGVSLGFLNGCQEGRSDNHSLLCSQNLVFDGRREEFFSDPELDCSSRKPDSKLIWSRKSGRVGSRVSDSIRTRYIEESDYSRSNPDGFYGNKSFCERGGNDHRDKALDLACVPSPSNHLDNVDSYSEPNVGSSRSERIDPYVLNRKHRYRKQIESSGAVGHAVGSRVGSSCPSVSDARMDGSSRSTSLFANEEVDVVDINHRGCGLSCCWSRTPRFRESNPPSDGEDHPLLLGEVRKTCLSGWGRSCTYKSEIAPYSDSPRSLSHKFRPKSFNELVGQNVVARSLLSAISKGRITSLYLFHGPRGTGKTSTARIFAAALNCLSLEEHRPCGLCRECVLFFSGRSRDVKEVDPVRTNRMDRVRSLLKNSFLPPVSSRYKVFITDECQLFRGEAWATILNSLDDLPRHVVFVMITADLDKLPRSAVSRCQKYHFPKIKDGDIASRLRKICFVEGLDFDNVALDFVAAKSNGSLRDAEMILDQLSLLGKRITMSLVYELIGIVSDDELLDLLDLALSSDTSNTVRRARELMRSRVDPMQLISQLANLIMDILAGRYQEGTSEVRRNFFGKHTSEVDLQKLRHALKVLSETEKQLRTSKNQTTWLTVALLQLSSVESSTIDAIDSRVCLTKAHQRDGGFCSTSSTGENLKISACCPCDDHKIHNVEIQRDCKGKLEYIWRRAIEICQSNTLKSFLQKEGKLSSVCVDQGLAVAEVEFDRPHHVSRAEKSWKLIASSLQLVLGCNVEIRINLVPCASATNGTKVKKPSFSLLSCSRIMQEKSCSTTEDGNDQSDHSDFTSERAMKRERPVETCSFDRGSQISTICSHRKEAATTLRNTEVNTLSPGATVFHRPLQDDTSKGSQSGIDSFKEEGENQECQVFAAQELENQPSCFSKTVRLHRKLSSSNTSPTIRLRIQPHNKLELAIPQKTSFETYFCSNDPYIFCSSSNMYSNSSGDEDRQRKECGVNSKVHCWRAPKFPLKKVIIFTSIADLFAFEVETIQLDFTRCIKHA
ncbi:hypothetical protein HHK36_015702 [Tetracentron sinense]|uniref:DNA-directed DNA polymerase n=1 Tax=Tetracentron sinense TaxID=13715 RepID=A0A834Z3J8_TETSI|nr:hypothetical protein HHK36_015702 [Tetracentron sinense]